MQSRLFFIAACLLIMPFLLLHPARAQNSITPDATMQSCHSNDECVLTNTACVTGCQFAPINRQFIASLQNLSQQSCGAPNETLCTSYPPLKAACINERCTIDYSFSGNADAKDYAPGMNRSDAIANDAIANDAVANDAVANDAAAHFARGTISVVPAAPRPADMPYTAFDRSGTFTADHLPPETVQRGSLGVLTVRPAR